MKRYKNYVTLPYDPLWQPLDWAKTHCLSYITNDVHYDGHYSFDNPDIKVDYFFYDEKEALCFALRWS